MKKIVRFLITNFYPLLKPILRLVRPAGGGVKVALFYKNKLLLIQNTYRKGWTLPGGGIKKNETSRQAAIREVYEELGIRLTSLEYQGSFINDFEKEKISVFSRKVRKPGFRIDDIEVAKAEWVNIKKVPDHHLLPVAKKCVELLKLV